MLKKLLPILLLTAFSVFGQADDPDLSVTIPVRTDCFPPQTLLGDAYHKFGEMLVLTSEYDPNHHRQIALLWNKKYKNYTLIEMRPVHYKGLDGKEHDDTLACIVSSGLMKFDLRALADFRS